MQTPLFQSIPFDQHVQHSQALQTDYNRHGVAYFKKVFNNQQLKEVLSELESMEQAAIEDLDLQWQSQNVSFFTKNPSNEACLKNAENFVTTDYFQSSADKIHVFFEALADRREVNRLGHGLHRDSTYPLLYKFIYDNSNLNSWLKTLGYQSPICLLSAYIPKLPGHVGSEVRPHQEATFAHTDPQSCCVLWIALEDATFENACMWGLLGSHTYPLKYISQVDRRSKTRDYVKINDWDIPAFDPQESLYTPLEVKAGDALIFHGHFVHCSPANQSMRSRKALTFQFVETQATQFSAFNWIASPNQLTLY